MTAFGARARRLLPGSTSDRFLALTAVAMVVPAWVAALRAGLAGHVPVGDTAIMALRAPDVLTRHPPLIGMPASSASTAGQVVHFPGALELYWLSVPVKVLGPTWGTVLAMAALNSIWILLAAWILRRNLSTTATACAYAVLAVFWWSIGSGMLVDSWPLLMVVVPFVLVVVASWGMACGDLRALVVAAVAGSYVWLDHLVLGVLAPVVIVTGLIGFVIWAVGAWRAARDEGPAAGEALRRRILGHVGAAAGVSLVLWLPTLIQQVTGSPGNLGLVLGRSGGGQEAIHSPSAAVHVVMSLVADPPFWFRGTLGDPTFYRAHHSGFAVGSVTWLDLVALVVVVFVFVMLGVSTVRRGDRTGRWLLGIAAAAAAGSALTVYMAPATTALVPEYLFPVWVAAMAVWLAVVVVAVRSVRADESNRLYRTAGAVTLVFAVLNLPASGTGYSAHPADTAVADAMIDRVVPELRSRQSAQGGPIGITLENPLRDDANTLSALLVGLRRAGVAFCYPTPNRSLYEFIPDCTGSEHHVVVLARRNGGRAPSGDVLFHGPAAAPVDTRRLAELDERVGAWLARTDVLRLTEAAQRPFLGPMIPLVLRNEAAAFARARGHLEVLVESEAFWDTIITWYERSDNRNAPLFVGQGVGNRDLYEWASLRERHDATLWVVERPVADRSS